MNTTDRYAKIREALKMGPTPGPWDGRQNDGSRWTDICRISNRYTTPIPYATPIALVPPYSVLDENDIWKESKDETIANAKHVAACDPDTIRELLAERDALAAENERLRDESDHERTIDQRDAAEDALGRMFQAITGRPAEWSSAWGYVDAIEEVEEHVAALASERAALAERDKEIASLRAECDFLQEVLDTRPAINAELPESYIRWSQSLYSGEAVRASLSARNAGGKDGE